MVSSLAWILLSGDTFRDVYGLPADNALVPFSQPGIVTIPLGFSTLIVVSLLTPPALMRAMPATRTTRTRHPWWLRIETQRTRRSRRECRGDLFILLRSLDFLSASSAISAFPSFI